MPGTQLLQELHAGQPPFQADAQIGRLGVARGLGRKASGQGFVAFQQTGGELLFKNRIGVGGIHEAASISCCNRSMARAHSLRTALGDRCIRSAMASNDCSSR